MTALAVSDPIDSIQVASPCPASWDDMRGDDKKRFCGACSKNVYNFAYMTRPEINTLIATTEGRVCGRLFRRADGTVMTSDCPVGLAERSYRHAKRMTLGVFCSLTLLLCSAVVFLFGKTTCKTGCPTESLANLRRVQAVVTKVQTTLAPPQAVAGGLRAPPRPVAPKVSPKMGKMGKIARPLPTLGEVAPLAEMGDVALAEE